MKTSLFRHILSLACLCLLLAACNPNYDMRGMFNGSSPVVDTRFAQSMSYNDSVGVTQVIVPSPDYQVYICTDSHIDSIPTNLTTFTQAALHDTACHLVLHLGDLVNADGHMDFAYSLVAPLLNPTTGKPFFITPGNHDIYFKQWTAWRAYFGSGIYWFYTCLADGTVLDRYICLDSADGTLGTDQIRWLQNLLKSNTLNQSSSPFRHTIVFTHTHLFKRDNSQGHTSNYTVEETHELLSILRNGGVDMYWCGHDHSREITEIGGFTSIVVDAIEDHYPPTFYMVAQVSDAITYRFIQLSSL